MKTVSLVISKSGKVDIQTKGFVGDSCKKATKSLEALLEGDDSKKNVVLEPEFYKQQNTQSQQQY